MIAAGTTETVDADYVKPARFIDSDHPAVAAFAARAAAHASEPVSAAVRLYYAVRDEILYDPYVPSDDLDTYRASAVLAKGRGYCVGKASLLAAAARALGIPARVAFADVRNHLATPRLLQLIGTDIFIYHGITELWLDGRWVKATPTFNLTLCEKFRIRPLDFDGRADAVFHPFDRDGRQHMEYLRQRGSFPDVPVDIIMPAMLATYPRLVELNKAPGGDFAKEAEEQATASPRS
ncbi:MAG TPA: transglutaminase-like domain-containing protein [Stellaceae bacterium]|nr:transglutaminase-like domain-containing protein [Stellaceae bacterium]